MGPADSSCDDFRFRSSTVLAIRRSRSSQSPMRDVCRVTGKSVDLDSRLGLTNNTNICMFVTMSSAQRVPRRSRSQVFRDVGFPAGEAEHLLIRSDLLIAVQEAIGARELSQVAAAKVLGVHPPRISDLMRGRVELFSIETLIEFLSKLGVRVSVTLRKMPVRSRR